MKSTKIAAIDIGSNAMRLLINNVIEHDGKKLFKKVDIVRVPIRLGTEAFTNQIITEATAERLRHALKAYSHLMKAHQVSIYRGCATSAMREASNGVEILAQVKKSTGIEIEIISGQEEAEIIYSTHIEKLIDSDKAYLYVDVGGGSTELTLFEGGNTICSHSFNIGTIRILNDMVSTPKWEQMEQWIKQNVKGKDLALIGSGGNINKVFKLSRKPVGEPLSSVYLNKYLKMLKSYTYEERIMELDLNPDRADVIIPALKIFTKVLQWTKATKVYVPKIGLSDGIIRHLAGEF